MQRVFSPHHTAAFQWIDDWYEYDPKEGKRLAMKARNDAAKRAKQDGYAVKKFSLPNQLVSLGGIGSGHPHIELFVTAYGFNAQ